jgi:hypothetical protein
MFGIKDRESQKNPKENDRSKSTFDEYGSERDSRLWA